MYSKEGEYRYIDVQGSKRAELAAPEGEAQGKLVIRGRIPFGETQLMASADETWSGKNYYERFASDVITSLPYKNCMLLRQHQKDSILGREGVSMVVRMEGTDLVFEAREIEGSQFFKDTHALIREGVLSGMSFHMDVMEHETKEEGKNVTTTITKISRMKELSVVAHPAYESTSAQTRSSIVEQIREYEQKNGKPAATLPNKAAILAVT